MMAGEAAEPSPNRQALGPTVQVNPKVALPLFSSKMAFEPPPPIVFAHDVGSPGVPTSVPADSVPEVGGSQKVPVPVTSSTGEVLAALPSTLWMNTSRVPEP